MWSSCQALSSRRQTRSKIFRSSGESDAFTGGVPVGMIAWWSVTLVSSTKRRPNGRSPVPGASSSRYGASIAATISLSVPATSRVRCRLSVRG